MRVEWTKGRIYDYFIWGLNFKKIMIFVLSSFRGPLSHRASSNPVQSQTQKKYLDIFWSETERRDILHFFHFDIAGPLRLPQLNYILFYVLSKVYCYLMQSWLNILSQNCEIVGKSTFILIKWILPTLTFYIRYQHSLEYLHEENVQCTSDPQ